MGITEKLTGTRVFIDTAPFIYFIEKHSTYLKTLKPVFAGINAGDIEGVTSGITLLEVLVRPLKLGDEQLADKYRQILLYSEGLTTYEITNEISEKAASLRATHGIKTPDAIQLAVGIIYDADYFLTNDPELNKVDGITVFILDDYLKR